MRHGNRSTRLGVKTGHRVAMLRNLTLGLIEHGRIKTTVARAKRLRPFVEKLVTRLKDPSVANLRLVNSELANRDATLAIARNIAPLFKDRAGGYLRILKLARPRAGDNADLALIEWVEESLVAAYQENKTVKAPAKKSASKAKKAAAPSKKVKKEDGKVEAKKAPSKAAKKS